MGMKELDQIARQAMALNGKQQEKIEQLQESNDDLIALNKQLVGGVKHLQAEVERLKSEPAKWIPCRESAPKIENTDVQAKVWFFDGTSVRRVPYYILKGCNEYDGTQEYKYGYWMAIPRPIKPKPPVKEKEQAND